MEHYKTLKIPSYHNYKEWKTENADHVEIAVKCCNLADRLRAESGRIKCNTQDVLIKNKAESNNKLEERILQEEYMKNELQITASNIQLELQPVDAMKRRIKAGIKYLESTGIKITMRCLENREGRIGIDLVHDNVELELCRERKTIEEGLNILKRSLEQIEETERRLRASLYFLNKDLIGKAAVLQIDKGVLGLKETDLGLCVYQGTEALDVANISLAEWKKYTEDKLFEVNKSLNKSRTIRAYLDTILKQVEQDLKNQDRVVNEAFHTRIEEVQIAKAKLEKQHYEVVRQSQDMARVIEEIEKDIASKEPYLALAHTRLGRRSTRPGVELVMDDANKSLVHEVVDVMGVVAQLRQNQAQAQAVQRKLLKTQIELEDDINIKMNSLKIDEVDCLNLRLSIRHPDL